MSTESNISSIYLDNQAVNWENTPVPLELKDLYEELISVQSLRKEMEAKYPEQ